MRVLGFDLENQGECLQNNWVLVNKENMNVPVDELYLQPIKQKNKQKI